ncbi:MAG: dephospho-CoA kinase [Planctomycetales bacterium]|nr:dephospho-CoA kinase [Planctomycetales bacterium]
MKVIGLVGGIASGKSSVARALAELGAVTVDADRIAHTALDHPDVKSELVERWGSAVVGSDGRIDRSEVAKRVFGDAPGPTNERRFLEQLLHPRVREQVESQLAERRQTELPAVVLDAPLLLEAGWRDLCDEVVFVDAPPAERLRRATTRGWSETQFSAREASQLPIEQKRSFATYVIDNSCPEAELTATVREFWRTRIVPDLRVKDVEAD